MASALSALKKATGDKKTLAEELKAEAPAQEPESVQSTETTEAPEQEAVEIDIEKMTAKEIDKLITDNGFDKMEGFPADWKKWKKDQKVAWMQENLAASDDQPAAEEAAAEAPVIAEPTPVEPEPTKPAKKTVTKSKSTAIATSSVKHGDVISPDDFSNAVSEIENLKAKDALALVKQLADAGDVAMFKLGGVLERIRTDGWFKELGFETFRQYVENTQDVGYRTALYWTGIYRNLVNSGIDFHQVASVKWSKLKEIAEVVTKENVEFWVEKANSNSIETLKLQVLNYKKSGSKQITDQLSEAPENIITTMQFKLHSDQKENVDAALEKAKAEASTDVNSVALEFICLAYNSNAVASKPVPQKSIIDMMKEAGIEEAAQALIDAFPEYQFEEIKATPVEG
jgi:hypothetical protein